MLDENAHSKKCLDQNTETLILPPPQKRNFLDEKTAVNGAFI